MPKVINMKTRAGRMEMLSETLADPDVTPKEKLSFFYHASKYELAILRRERVRVAIKKHATANNEILAIRRFRKELNEL